MADDIPAPGRIPGLAWRDAAQDRDRTPPGPSRSPYRRASQKQPPTQLPSDHHEGEGEREEEREGKGEGEGEPTVLGLPAHLLSPRLEESIAALMRDMEDLRDALGQAQGREAYLLSLSQGDGTLPVLNRRATLDALHRLLEQSRVADSGIVVAAFQAETLDIVRHVSGRTAALAALSAFALVLLRHGALSAVCGSLGGGGLVVARERRPDESAARAYERLSRWAEARCCEAPDGLSVSHHIEVSRPGDTLSSFLQRLDKATLAPHAVRQ